MFTFECRAPTARASRVFGDRVELEPWLAEALTPEEQARVNRFLDGG